MRRPKAAMARRRQAMASCCGNSVSMTWSRYACTCVGTGGGAGISRSSFAAAN